MDKETENLVKETVKLLVAKNVEDKIDLLVELNLNNRISQMVEAAVAKDFTERLRYSEEAMLALVGVITKLLIYNRTSPKV